MESDIQLTSEDVRRLLELFSICHYKTKDNDKRTNFVQKICTNLWSKDYKDLEIINNENGELASSYPSKLIIPLIGADDISLPQTDHTSLPHTHHQKTLSQPIGDDWDEVDSCRLESPIKRSNTLTNGTNRSIDSTFDSLNNLTESKLNSTKNSNKRLDVNKLKELISRARVARCRARFPIPVILYKDKYICRSATLSGGPEIYGRSGLDYLFNDYKNSSEVESNDLTQNLSPNNGTEESIAPSIQGLSLNNISDTSHLFSKVRNRDIELLKYLSVGYICDLMVEKKKVKFGMNVTSSEKADKESRYQDFNIMSLPYPGCEFFRDYRDNGYSAEGLIYDWKQHFVDANLIVPKDDRICERLNIDWKQYRSWDVIKLTQNYLKLLLLYFHETDSSILIHCISGWDRTPLFTSLLRLSLWADGKIHQNLSPIEMTFLTISYDWFLFGHNLNDRLNKGEEILFFCFYFLKYITSDEFSIDFLINNCCKQRKQSMDQTFPGEEHTLLYEDHTLPKYGGSSTSLNSSCSSVSTRSHDNCPPLYFPIINNEDLFPHRYEFDPIGTYGKTPPTLTNSEEGCDMFTTKSLTIDSTLVNRLEEPVKQCSNSSIFYAKSNNKTTEPVAIPTQKKILAENGLSSLSRSDSWQLVSDTGSIRESSMRYSSPDSLSSPKTNGNSVETSSSSNSDTLESKHSNRVNDRNERMTDKNGFPKSNQMRKERLQAVRSLFYNSYSSAIGFKFKNGGDSSTRLSSIIDHFAGTVGIYSNRVSAPQ